MREIGQRIKEEQNLTGADIFWLVSVVRMILRAFVWNEGLPMRAMAESLGILPTTLYKKLRLVVKALMLIRRGVESVDGLVDCVRDLQDQLGRAEQAYATAQMEVQRLTKALAEAQARIAALQGEVKELQKQWKMAKECLIVVLKMEGRCTVRSIVAVLRHGLGIHVSVGYVQGIIAQAGVPRTIIPHGSYAHE